jgi:hypothetical protein
MNTLLQTLNNFEEYLTEKRPNFVRSFLPSLSREQIDEIVSGLPFYLSEEIYTLYQWHNGIDVSIMDDKCFWLTDYDRFFSPLEICLEDYYELIQVKNDINDVDEEFVNTLWFPISRAFGESYTLTTGDSQRKKTSELISIWTYQDWVFGPNFDSLTSYIETVYDCYLAGIYSVDEEEHIIDNYNSKKYMQIYKKHNPNQPELR